jgi:hypothetical protein
VRAVNRESLGKRVVKRMAKNIAQFFKHYALGLLEAASDEDTYTHSYESCWCPENSDYCTCEERGMVPRWLLETEMCMCYGEQCVCPER